MNRYRPEVLAGIALFDEHYGCDWPMELDLDTLDLDHARWDIAGQLCRDIELVAMPPKLRTENDRSEASMRVMGCPTESKARREWRLAHGFMVDGAGRSTSEVGAMVKTLHEEWLTLIYER